MSALNDLTGQALRSLAQTRAEEDTVLSLYLDLDPARFATARARAGEIDSLLDAAHREVNAGERSNTEREALRTALEQAREMLVDQSWPQGGHAIVLFLSVPLGLTQLLRLPHPVRSAFVIADTPFIAPLTESGPVGRVCVTLVDERFARILRGSADGLHETISFGDDVHGRQEQGGWSQSRFQRSRHEDIKAHLRHVAHTLHLLLRVAPYDRLLIACTEQLWPRIVEQLPADVRALLHDDRLVLDVGDAGVEDVVSATRPALAEEHSLHQATALAELRAHCAHQGDQRAAVGLEQVLLALEERRVGTLFYEANLDAAGVLCPRCGWIGAGGESCPLDGAPLQTRANIVNDAVLSAVGQSAEMFSLRDSAELAPFGGIAATLRF
jgi:peptide subunit release factor 1 (eRF1)